MAKRCGCCNSMGAKRYKIHLTQRSLHSKHSKRMNLCEACIDCMDECYIVQRGDKYNKWAYNLLKKQPKICLIYNNLEIYKTRLSLLKRGINVI